MIKTKLTRESAFDSAMTEIETFATQSTIALEKDLEKTDAEIQMKLIHADTFAVVASETDQTSGKAKYTNADSREAETKRRLIDSTDYEETSSNFSTARKQGREAQLKADAAKLRAGIYKAYLQSLSNEQE